MTDKEKRTSERLTDLFKRLNEQGKDHLLTYGEGMADMQERLTAGNEPQRAQA